MPLLALEELHRRPLVGHRVEIKMVVAAGEEDLFHFNLEVINPSHIQLERLPKPNLAPQSLNLTLRRQTGCPQPSFPTTSNREPCRSKAP